MGHTRLNEHLERFLHFSPEELFYLPHPNVDLSPVIRLGYRF